MNSAFQERRYFKTSIKSAKLGKHKMHSGG
jgi:hypothetical protein